MIGRYLQLLTPEEEDRILTSHMQPGDYVAPCLVGAALGIRQHMPLAERAERIYANLDRQVKAGLISVRTPDVSVETWYDELCERFGVDRINTLIRNRILRHRAERVLVVAALAEVAS